MDPVAIVLTPTNFTGYVTEINWTRHFAGSDIEFLRHTAPGLVLLVDEEGPRLLSLRNFFTEGYRFENENVMTYRMSCIRKEG